MPTRRPLADPPPALDMGPTREPAPLARRPAATRRAPQPPPPAHAPASRRHAPPPQPADEPQLPLGTIVLSLPIAVTVGDMIVSRSMDPLPQALLWGGLMVAWQTVSSEEFRQGTLDWAAGAIDLPPVWRQRLKLDERPAVERTKGRGLVGGLVADVAAWRGAVAARAGGAVGGDGPPAPATLERERKAEPDGDRRGGGTPSARLAAVDAAIDAPVAHIGLPVVQLEDAARVDNLWVVGAKGSGKTTVLRRLIGLRAGTHIAVDPHNTPGKWPGCAIIGGGRDFAAIEAGLQKAIARMDARYKAMDRGEITEEECKAAAFTIVGDEWMSITEALPGRRASRDEPENPAAADQLLTLLTEGRKAGMRVLAASHADTATAMGLSGKKDVLKCFDLVIYLGAMAVERVPESAAMPRPAVVYDPERRAYAQLVIGSAAPAAPVAPPAPPSARAPASPEPHPPPPPTRERRPGPPPVRRTEPAPAAPLPANVIRLADRRPQPAPATSAPPAPAPDRDLLVALLADTDLSAVSPERRARLERVLTGAPPAQPASPPPTPPAAETTVIEGPDGRLIVNNTVTVQRGAGGGGGRRRTRAGTAALSDEDRAKLPAARALAQSVGKTEAIRRVYGVSGGDRYSAIARAFDDSAA